MKLTQKPTSSTYGPKLLWAIQSPITIFPTSTKKLFSSFNLQRIWNDTAQSIQSPTHKPHKMGNYVQIQYFSKNPMFVGSSFLNKDPNFEINAWSNRRDSLFTPKKQFQLKYGRRRYKWRGQLIVCNGFLFQLDQWASNVDSPALASLLSAFSLLPYMGFLYFITKSKSAPKLTLFGFYFLLVFVGGASKLSSCFHFFSWLSYCWIWSLGTLWNICLLTSIWLLMILYSLVVGLSLLVMVFGLNLLLFLYTSV